MVKGKVAAGQNVLITGIGGGVAIAALQLCIAKGANVYVTSSNEDKIRKAIELGAKGGANYKNGTFDLAVAISSCPAPMHTCNTYYSGLAITNCEFTFQRREWQCQDCFN